MYNKSVVSILYTTDFLLKYTYFIYDINLTFIVSSIFLSILETCTCVIPIIFATCICVLSLKNLKYIYTCLAIICGSIAGIWSFSANRFRDVEILFIIVIGMVIGVCLGIVCHSILKYIKR